MLRLRPNGKLILILFAGTLVLGLGVHFLHKYQLSKSANLLKVRAEQARKDGRLEDAESFLTRFLLLQPGDITGQLAYAQLIDERGPSPANQLAALRAYERVVRLDESQAEARRRLIDLAIELELYSQAQPNIEHLRQARLGDGELTFLLGRCAEGTGDFTKAAELYEQALRQNPSRVEAYERLASILRTKIRDSARADAVMDAQAEKGGLITKNPGSATAYLARARYRARYAVPGVDPAADIARALELAPDDAEVILAAAGQAQAKNDIARARVLLERGIKLHPKNGPMYQNLADLEQQAGQGDRAIGVLSAGLAALKDEPGFDQALLRWGLVNVLITVGRLDDAEAEVKALRDQALRPELLGYLDARILAARGQHAAAARKVRDLVPELAAVSELADVMKRSLVLQGECYERLGNTDQRYDAFSRAVAIELDPDPLWVPARLGLAAALVDMNRIVDAIEQYQIILPREPGAGFALARLQITQNLRRPAENRQWQEIEQTLSTIERGLGEAAPPPAAAETAILRAEVLVARGEISPARRLVEEAIGKYPDQVDLWVALANLAGREGKPEETLAVLDQARGKLGDRPELRLARIAYWVRRGGEPAAAELEQLDRESAELPPDERYRVRLELAAGFFRLGKAERSAALWKQLAEQFPDDLEVRLILFDLALRAGDQNTIDSTLAEIRRIEGEEEGTIWRFGRALVLLDQARKAPADRDTLAEARALLQQVVTRRPNWARAPMALSQIEQLAGNIDAAIQHGVRAVLDLGEREPESVARVLQLLIARGRVDEAGRIVLQLREEQVPLSGELQKLASQASFRSGDAAFALDLARRSVNDDTKDPAELMWLGLLQAAAGENAEPTLRRAVALDPADPEARLALIRYLVASGRTEDARAALAEAEKALPADRGRLQLAQALEAVGDRDRADQIYKEVLVAKPDDVPTLRAAATSDIAAGRLGVAQNRLERIIRLEQGKGTSIDAAWARRMVPLILGVSGDKAGALRALEALGLASSGEAGSAAATPEDLRARAQTLALQPNRVYRSRAIETLDELVRRRAAMPGDLQLLAQLLEANGDWNRARTQMLEVLRLEATNPELIAGYIRALLRHNQLGEVDAWLAQLKKLVSDAPGVVEIEARVLVARNQPAEAVGKLQAFAGDDPARLGPVARLLEELGQYAPAEAMYRRFNDMVRPSNPQAVVVLAGFLGRRGRTDEALAVLDDEAWRTLPAATVSNAAVTILYNARSDDDAPRAAVADRIAALIGDHPDLGALRFDLANVRTLQGRYDDAEAIYRELHERDKTISAPLNNLAWLLALRGGDRASEALTLIQQAIGLEGEAPDVLDTRALAYIANGQADLAIRDLEDSLVVSPLPETYFHLAWAHHAKGQGRDAEDALRRAQELGLTIEGVHPLERPALRQLLAALTPRS